LLFSAPNLNHLLYPAARKISAAGVGASMGPRSDNRGYVNNVREDFTIGRFQWIHGQCAGTLKMFKTPRSENRKKKWKGTCKCVYLGGWLIKEFGSFAMPFYAHSPPNGLHVGWHLLADHLCAVADLAKERAKSACPVMTSVRGWCDGTKAEAIEICKTLLRARLDAPPTASKPPLVRRYRLGPTTLVRDQRSGRSTGRLDVWPKRGCHST
jgi:hypothetical protein